ncbi:HAD-IIA family hydrolase [Aeromicrobium terrae]|uniref:HAD-IIA family hydrolase n=1 Tax=Aeromicrobium terrae TaxID=2498846 RepID=A0A5C8NPG4_9ACTN|nr:HAD-IIA family hydrolase [Aeromicrobium terrae]TXL63026.1 HAD-IIA family hydrolase [Aeromicrobium terrae]
MSLASSDQPLTQVHDAALLDLDGVVYVGADAVPGAVEAIEGARGDGLRIAYLTNNASRTAREVAQHLRDLGLTAEDTDVVTAAEAVAHLVADAVPEGAAVLLVGGEGLREPLERRGLRCVQSADDQPAAVVQGFHPDLAWRVLAEASYAIERGVPWFASNADLTIPTDRGIAPGNGSLIQAVSNATGQRPTVAGKPERALFDETVERVGAQRPLMVGDRFDTDIDGAVNAGIDSLAVLTGVGTLAGLLELEPGHRPTYVAHDVSGLLEPHPPVEVGDDAATCGDARAHVDDGTVALRSGEPASLEALRAVVALAWAWRDRSGSAPRLDGTLET